MSTLQDFSRHGLLVSPDAVPDLGLQREPENDPGTLVLGGGCFWCTELLYRQLRGVSEVTSGYSGGEASLAHYRDVCTGESGHAEVIQIQYDATQVGMADLLRVFFLVAHNPTQLDRQGADIGSHYRSVVFCSNAEQAEFAQKYINQLDELKIYSDKIVTAVEMLDGFYPAEPYHQDYAGKNPYQPYVRHVAEPKLKRLERYFESMLS